MPHYRKLAYDKIVDTAMTGMYQLGHVRFVPDT